MFALLALISFILALFGAEIGSVNLITLGLVFIAAHLMWTITLPTPAFIRRNSRA